MVLGMCMIVDGYPIVFFLKETLRLAPGSTAFTAAFMGLGFILMIPFTFLRQLYKPNYKIYYSALAFLGIGLIYLFFYNSAGATGTPEFGKDIINFIYVFLFIFLLLNVPNDVSEVGVQVIVLFTLVSNLALVFALVTDPTWVIGQRAAIQYGVGEDRTGNPHVFARNAVMGVLSSLVLAQQIYTNRPLWRLASLASAFFSFAILIMTQTRTSVVALLFMGVLFVMLNFHKISFRSIARSLVRPASLVVLVGMIGLLYYASRRYGQIFDLLSHTLEMFIERNTENVYALLGMKTKAQQAAAFDPSSANRVVSLNFTIAVFMGHAHTLFVGQGWKFFYMDVPYLEVLICHGLFVFFLYAYMTGTAFFIVLKNIIIGTNPWETFIGYFYIYLFTTLFTGGRPYDIMFWHAFSLAIRYLGIRYYSREEIHDYMQARVASNGMLSY